MIKKIVPLLVFLFVLSGVGFFVFRAIQTSEGDSSEQSQVALSALNQLKNQGLSNLNVTYADGKKFDLSSIQSPIVILNFWASWCGPCVEEIPSFVNLIKEYGGQISLLAVSLDSDLGQMEQFLKGFDIKNKNIHVLTDPAFEVAQSLGTTKLPESYILGPDRKLVRKISGSIDWTSVEMRAYINNLLTNP